jgi:hypothetical protein
LAGIGIFRASIGIALHIHLGDAREGQYSDSSVEGDEFSS